MNYFAHALPYLDRPYFIAGTALPDWLSVVDRKLRIRPKHLAEPLASGDVVIADLAAGAARHLHDDGWFHATRGFAEVTAAVGLMFREGLAGSDGFRCGFLGHIVTELLLDAELIARYPQHYRSYYSVLAEVEPESVAACVSSWTARDACLLARFIRLYLEERILDDYFDDRRLLRRLNQVLLRVKLAPLPEGAAAWIAEGRSLVGSRSIDLLPPEHYPWPDAT